MSPRRVKLPAVGDSVRVYRELTGRMPDGTTRYRATRGATLTVESVEGERITLVSRSGARCVADPGDVELISKRAKQ